MTKQTNDPFELLKLTVLPFRITARAWVDAEYRAALLAYPRTFLVAHSVHFPRDVNYVVVPDTPSIKCFTIPHLPSTLAKASRAEVLELIEREIGDEEPFGQWLPPAVLARALTDEVFLRDLTARGVSLLRQEGYRAPADMAIYQNSATTYHFPLRLNPGITQTFSDALTSIRGDSMVVSSSQCCASGTCC